MLEKAVIAENIIAMLQTYDRGTLRSRRDCAMLPHNVAGVLSVFFGPTNKFPAT